MIVNLKERILGTHTRQALKYILFLLLNMIMLNGVLFNGLYNVSKVTKDQSVRVIKETIDEFNEIDLEHLCSITNCKGIRLNDFAYTLQSNILKFSQNTKNYDLKYKMLNLNNNFNLIVSIPEFGISLIRNSKESIISLLVSYLYINLYFFLMYTAVFLYIEFTTRRRTMLDRLDTSNTLREKNMQILTENIHHELNTPLAIIQGNVRMLEIEMNKEENYCIIFNFAQMYSSIDQIDGVLQRMSNFKNLKYSNGNKTIHDIVAYSSNSMKIYKKSNFEIELTPKLKQYGLRGSLKNGDLLNVLSNHFRNSIEAMSTKIVVDVSYDIRTRQLHIYIIDNGVGLRDRESGLLLREEQYSNIFKLYYSSKDKDGKSKMVESKGWIIDSYTALIKPLIKPLTKITKSENLRGVGLYLNKELIVENGGNIFLKSTSKSGTIFEIVVEAVPRFNKPLK